MRTKISSGGGWLGPMLIAGLLLVGGPAFAASVADWRHDIDEIVGTVKSVHPDPFLKVGRIAFLRQADALKRALPQLTEEERGVGALRLVASLGDAHTSLEPAEPLYSRWYPVRITEFTDGYFITSAHRSVADLAGAQVIEIAGRPVRDVAEAARDLVPADNRFWRKESLYPLLNAAMMTGLHFAASDGALSIRVKLRGGQVVERTLQPRTWAERSFSPDLSSMDWRFGRTEISGPPMAPSSEFVSAWRGLPATDFRAYDPSRPLQLSQRGLAAHAVPGQDAYYIFVNIWQDNDTESVTAFFARAFKEVDQLRPRRLIIDLRYNPGGDGSSGDRIIQEILARRDRLPWKEFYLLVSGRTYSASLLIMAKLREFTDVSLVGEPAGGPLNFFGDYSTFQLPRTGFELRVAALRHQASQSDDLRAFVPVDVPAPMSFADYVAGRDPAIDPILKGEEMRNIAAIALADGGAAARSVYHARAARFADSGMWSPPSEPELRQVAIRLQDEKRVADAIEVFALASEIHPDEWRSWYNLGNAQLAAGRKDQAMASYRRCLALDDPTNFNADWLARQVADYEASKAKGS